ncbi:MAG: hypothetical protein K5686_07985 [Lachnospiraceae bacterium]|nr:hypothetical protein [Lachnospiraceae bacterium]
MKKKIIMIICGVLVIFSACGKDSKSVIELHMETDEDYEKDRDEQDGSGDDGDVPVAVDGSGRDREEKNFDGSADEEGEEMSVERKDGERFEDVITIEGMEEKVIYEHVRNEALGFEIDYDCGLFIRRSEPDKESFICIYDKMDDPENYLELTYRPQDMDSVIKAISEELSVDYEIIEEPYMLGNAGSCIRIDASASADGSGTPDRLQMVYIIPAADGTLVGTAHYGFESAEGFGRRFSYIMKTLTLINRN